MKKLLITTMAIVCLIACSKDNGDSAPGIIFSGISPTSGPKNTLVTISGSGFGTNLNSVKVFFNNDQTDVRSVEETSIVAEVPVGSGTGLVTIEIDGKTFEGPEFTYILTATVTTLAGSIQGYANGIGDDSQFSVPNDVAVDSDGNVYVADRGNHRIRKITTAGEVSNFAGNGTEGYSNGDGANAQFELPEGIAVDAQGNVYVSDTYNDAIRKITPTGQVSTLAGGRFNGDSDGLGEDARFNRPRGLVVDAEGNVYVADSFNNKIKKITPLGQVTTLAGSGELGDSDGQGGTATFKRPNGVTIDTDGNLYVTDRNNHKIRKITSTGTVSTVAGTGVDGDENGLATEAQFNLPEGIAADAEGNLYVADYGSSKIRMISSNGLVSTLAGNSGGFSDGINENALFQRPGGLAVDTEGNIYVADQENHKIRKIRVD